MDGGEEELKQKEHFGIELDVPDANATDGTYGKREKPYFNCAANRGVFVQFKDIQELVVCSPLFLCSRSGHI